MSLSKRRSPEETRTKILQAAFDLFNSRSYSDLNSNDIARHAGVAVGSFYNYFDSKLSVFVACYDDWVQSEWVGVADWLAKPSRGRSSSNLLKLLLAEHQRAVQFRNNLNALCYLSVEVQQHRDRKRLSQCMNIAGKLAILGRPSPSLVVLQSTLNNFEFLLDVLASERQSELGLTSKAIQLHLQALIESLTGS